MASLHRQTARAALRWVQSILAPRCWDPPPHRSTFPAPAVQEVSCRSSCSLNCPRDLHGRCCGKAIPCCRTDCGLPGAGCLLHTLCKDAEILAVTLPNMSGGTSKNLSQLQVKSCLFYLPGLHGLSGAINQAASFLAFGYSQEVSIRPTACFALLPGPFPIQKCAC